MKNIFLILLFLSIHAIGQRVAVVSTSNDPVEFASVAYYKDGKISEADYADKNGVFNCTGRNFDSLEISCIGFETKRIAKASIAEKISLEEMPIALEEVVINSNQAFDIGYSKVKCKKIKSSLGIDKFAQMAVFIENPFKTAVVITSVSLT